jgi:hypothetical protein
MPRLHARWRAGATCSLFAIGSAFVAAPASAEVEQPTRVSFVSVLGYSGSVGFTNPPNVFGLAVGLRAGATAPTGLYIGGLLIEHGGYSLRPAAPAVGSTAPARGWRTVVGGEVGYDWETPIVFRIYIGAGALVDRGADIDGHGNYVPLSTGVGFGMWPGVTVFYPVRQLLFGLDAHLTIPGQSDAAVGPELLFVVGTRFCFLGC